MQAGILDQIGDRDRVVAQVLRTLEAARGARVRTVFMRHVTMPTELMGAAQLRMWMAWQRAGRASDVVSPFPSDAPQTRLIPDMAPNAHEAVIDKVTMSAFEGTPLDTVLRDCGITAVAIVGVALEVGIEPTARQAADPRLHPHRHHGRVWRRRRRGGRARTRVARVCRRRDPDGRVRVRPRSGRPR